MKGSPEARGGEGAEDAQEDLVTKGGDEQLAGATVKERGQRMLKKTW